MNELVKKFDDRLQVLAFPANQFNHQENAGNDEILTMLKYIRPGNGYEPLFPIMEKGDVNGSGAQEIFKYLKCALPYPVDRTPELDMEEPYGVMDFGTPLWDVRLPSDIHWNFEKFLIDQSGVPVKRFSPKFETIKIADHIAALIDDE
jgi:glutathione peroxidase